MIPAELTRSARRTHKSPVPGDRSCGGRAPTMWMVLVGAGALGGCITVNAPEEPIVIELNINITQEVIYRLAEDVRDNIEANPEIF